MQNIIHINNISEMHKIMGIASPKHPLISVVDFSKVTPADIPAGTKVVSSCYSITLKSTSCGSMIYGRKRFDFQEGALFCMAPDQVLTVEQPKEESYAGLGLFFHPDLIRQSALGKKISEYSYFSYEMDEALHLSEDEKQNIYTLFNSIAEEYSANLDDFSQDLILSKLELLLNYCRRYYGRQFITRSSYNRDVLSQLEHLLTDYFNTDKSELQGIPSVKYCASQLNFSPNYLSDLVKKESGKSVQEHIHKFLIEKAKSKLLTTTKSVSEIANELGFEYSQYFSKIFKLKTGYSPGEYRKIN